MSSETEPSLSNKPSFYHRHSFIDDRPSCYKTDLFQIDFIVRSIITNKRSIDLEDLPISGRCVSSHVSPAAKHELLMLPISQQAHLGGNHYLLFPLCLSISASILDTLEHLMEFNREMTHAIDTKRYIWGASATNQMPSYFSVTKCPVKPFWRKSAISITLKFYQLLTLLIP